MCVSTNIFPRVERMCEGPSGSVEVIPITMPEPGEFDVDVYWTGTNTAKGQWGHGTPYLFDKLINVYNKLRQMWRSHAYSRTLLTRGF